MHRDHFFFVGKKYEKNNETRTFHHLPFKQILMSLPALTPEFPIHDILDDIRKHLAKEHNLVLEAPTGAGKTTIVPIALLEEVWLQHRKIIMLQPRRIAAKNAAQRMATLIHEPVGKTVGYRMRLERKISSQTRIEVITEGVLLRMLRDDPSLSEVGLLIFDEFHERSLDADLGLTLALKARDTFEHDVPLRIMLMSATLGTTELENHLRTTAIRSEGRLFSVSERYEQSAKPGDRVADRITKVIHKALAAHPHSSLLVFLPGQGEIHQVLAQVQPPDGVAVRPLYGNLSLAEQQLAIAPSAAGKRKVVLATNIAETSLTIDGVDVVIDSGLERKPQFDPNTGMSRLVTVKISQSASEQRKGRAGRLRPGTCYRLWSESQQQQLIARDEPEILNTDLASLVLQLFAFGMYDRHELSWLTDPPTGPYDQATDLLATLNAIHETDAGLRLTSHGDAMAAISVHPRLAHMLIMGVSGGARVTAGHLAAVLSDRDPVSRESVDMRTRLDYLSEEVACPAIFRGWQKRTQQLAEQFLRQTPSSNNSDNNNVACLPRPSKEQIPGFLIACAYPDRIARARLSGGYQLANGRSCQFETPNQLSTSKWLAIAEVGGVARRKGDVIRAAAPLDPELFESVLADQISKDTVVDWDTKTGRFIAERHTRCGALLLRRENLTEVSDEARIAKLIELTRGAELANLPWSDKTEEFLAKATIMAGLEPDWPSFEKTRLIQTLADWLAPYLTSIKKLSELKKLDLLSILQSQLSWEQLQKLNAELPERFQAPSGSAIKIDYRETPPVLAVKLQEMFGSAATPTIASGRIALMIHLLSPAGRALQVTQDLSSFWNNGYDAVKKEMRGRYPKHPWPDDPAGAAPTKYTKRRR